MWSVNRDRKYGMAWFDQRVSSDAVQWIRTETDRQGSVPSIRPVENGWYEVQRSRSPQRKRIFR